MRIRVPATSANLGPGFDTLGMALQFYNHFESRPADSISVNLLPGTCVETEGLSLDIGENLLAQAYQAYFNFRELPVTPVELLIEAHVPLSRGLGSSSSAIVAGLFLADQGHPEPVGKSALLEWAVAMEGHPDNVMPALMGGVHCATDHTTSIRLTWPEDWGIILVIPQQPLSTDAARALMPQTYPQSDIIQNLRGIATWIYALDHQDSALFKLALQADTIHQPYRSKLIPEFELLREILSHTDAMGPIISGSGSTLAVYTPNASVQIALLNQLKAEAQLSHCKIIPVKPDTEGVRLI